jgi:hypothetical protein
MKKTMLLTIALLSATAFAAKRNLPVPPNWDPFLTRSGALNYRHGHTQGMCVTSNNVYMTLHKGIYKFDWYGRLLARVEAPPHQGDICWWNGRLYVAMCVPDNVPKRGRIYVFDESLSLVKIGEFEKPADGIVCLDGVLYVGLGPVRDPSTGKPKLRGNWFGKFDAETLEPLCEPFVVDHGYDVSAGVQNLATDGERIYMSVYTPEEDYPCFFVMDKDLKVLSAHVFGWRHGFDVIGGGKNGAVRFVHATTINWMAAGSKLKPDPSPPQALVRYAELKDGEIRDMTHWIIFEKEKER